MKLWKFLLQDFKFENFFFKISNLKISSSRFTKSQIWKYLLVNIFLFSFSATTLWRRNISKGLYKLPGLHGDSIPLPGKSRPKFSGMCRIGLGIQWKWSQVLKQPGRCPKAPFKLGGKIPQHLGCFLSFQINYCDSLICLFIYLAIGRKILLPWD